eukprot:Pgem_evm2s1795
MFMSFTTFLQDNCLAILVLAVTLFFPFVLAVIHSLDVFMMMLFNFLPYFLFLPTFLPWFFTYAVARTWDLSWGNRPTTTEVKMSSVKNKLRIRGGLVLLFVILANMGTTTGFILIDNANTLLYVSSGIIGVGITQQILSLIYYLFKTDHTMLSSLDNLNKTTMKILSTLLFLITIALLLTGTLTTAWLTRTMQVDFIRSKVNYTLHQTYVEQVNDVLQVYDDLNIGNQTESIFERNEILDVTMSTHTENRTVMDIRRMNQNSPTYENDLLFCYQGPSRNVLKTNYYLNYTQLFYYIKEIDHNKNETKIRNGTLYWSYINMTVFLDNNLIINCDIHTLNNAQTMNYLKATDRGLGKKFNTSNDNLGNESNTNSKINELNAFQGDVYQTIITANLTQNQITVTEKYDAGYLKVEYGLLRVKFKWDTADIVYKSQTTTWGPSFIWDTPNRTWGFSLLCIVAACFLLSINVVSILYSFVVADKSRAYSVTVLYSWIGMIALFFGIFLFPFAWGDLNTYKIGWWDNLSIIQGHPVPKKGSMCGNTDFFNPGLCQVNWSYILVIVSFCVGLISFSTVRFTLEKRYRYVDPEIVENVNKEKAQALRKKEHEPYECKSNENCEKKQKKAYSNPVRYGYEQFRGETISVDEDEKPRTGTI